MHSSNRSARYSLALGSIMLFVLCSCLESDNDPFIPGTFSETVAPLSGANSQYDDYNSAATPTLVHLGFPFSFSSNRATQGGTFDIENFEVKVHWDQRSGAVSLNAEDNSSSSPWPDWSSASNEFGPFHIESVGTPRLYLFASDRNGNLDIFHAEAYGTEQPSVALNSVADDAYPSLGQDNSFYFSSNRSGNYDIFSAPVPTGQSIKTFLETAGATPAPVNAVNSGADDKAPYINGKLMVFASNRPGGHGGYDLWYSIQGEGGWSQPVNFGPNINKASDEFRPVVLVSDPVDFTNDLMIFSSDRPGGLGGFDLYFVGIPRLTQ